MTTKTTTVYIAYDGTVFEDEVKCEEYEYDNLHNRLSPKCIFLDDAERRITLEVFLSNPIQLGGVYVPDEEQAKIVHQILVDNDLISPWDDDDICFTPGYYWCGMEGDKYADVEKNLKFWKNIYNSFRGA